MIRIGLCCEAEEMNSLWEERITEYMRKERLPFDIDFFSYKGLLFDVENNNIPLEILVLDLRYYASCDKSQDGKNDSLSNRKDFLDGVEIGKRVNEICPTCVLIFCYENEGEIEETFETNCCYVIRKNNIEKYIDKAICKAVSRIEDTQRGGVLKLIADGKKTYIQIRDILYIERDNRKINVVTEELSYSCNMSLKDLEKDLDESMVRIHGGYIVNILKIRKVSRRRVELDNGRVLPIGRTFEDGFFKRWEK